MGNSGEQSAWLRPRLFSHQAEPDPVGSRSAITHQPGEINFTELPFIPAAVNVNGFLCVNLKKFQWVCLSGPGVFNRSSQTPRSYRLGACEVFGEQKKGRDDENGQFGSIRSLLLRGPLRTAA